MVSGATATNGTILWTEDGVGSITSSSTIIAPTYTPDVLDEGNTVTLTLTVSSDNACIGETAQAFYTVDVVSSPTAPTSGFSDMNNFCEDDAGNINLTVSGGTGGTVHWFDDICGGNEIGTGTPLVLPSPTATTTYFARYESTCGVSDCFNFDVSVAEPPVVPIKAESDINDICADHSGNVELTVDGGSGDEVQWFTISCGGSSIGTGDPLVIPSPDVTTTYYARWANACGESDCVEHTVTVIQLPTDATSASTDYNDFCADDSGNITLSLTGGSGDEVYWYTVACGDTPAGTGTPLILESPTANTTYFARWENSCGVSACEQVDINVIEAPQAPTSIVPSANDICADDAGTIDLAAVGGSGTTLRWYTGLCEGTDVGTGNPLTIDSPTVNTEYFVSWENSCGVTTCASVLINVIDSPLDPTEATVDVDEVCADDAGNITLNLIGGEGPTVEWYSGSCGGVPVGTGNPLVIESPLVTTTYYGRYESSCGISECVSVEVLVIDAPAPPVSAEVDRTDFCSDDDGNINLSVTGGSGTAVHWYIESCGTTEVGLGNPLIIESPEATTTYYGRWENACGVTVCQNILVTVVQSADASINSVAPLCISASPIVVTAAELGGTWSGTGIDSNTGLFNPATAGVGDHLITYTITGTCGSSDQITISVVDNFDATIDDVNPICENSSEITLTAATDGGVWSGNGITDADLGTFDPSVAGEGNHTITYENTGACGGSDDIVIVVNPDADATISPVGPFCDDADPIVITAAEIGGTWSGTAIDPTTGFFDPELAGIGDHIITYTIAGECGDSDQITVSVLKYFDATITSGIDLCLADTLTILTAAEEGGVWEGPGITIIDDVTYLSFTDIGAGDYEIIYHYDGLCGDADTVTVTIYPVVDASIYPVDTLTDEDEPIQLTTVEGGGIWDGIFVDDLGMFDPVEAGAAAHPVIYTIDGPCGDADTVNIIVIPAPIDDLLIPTVITPDNDGLNDSWRIQGIEAYDQISIKIFTRWGDEVFVFDGTGELYENVSNQWNGKFKDRDLPTGSYLYVLILEGDSVYKGTIGLIR